jgi:lysophospholipase L1-like esterase
MTFVALGDSITVGLGDGISMGARGSRGRGDGQRGWAAHLAPSLPMAYENLATTGARIRDIRQDQLPEALNLRPQVAGLIAGMNDVIRTDFEAARVASDLSECAQSLRATGAIVLMARLHDPGALLWMPRRIRHTLLGRITVLNATVTSLAAQDPGVLVLDLPAHPECYALASWDVDRVHPSRRGHQVLAHGFCSLLAGHGIGIEVPALGERPKAPAMTAHGWWLMSKGLPWLVLQSRGVLPAARGMMLG